MELSKRAASPSSGNDNSGSAERLESIPPLQGLPLGAIDPALLLFSDRPYTAPVNWGSFRHILVLGDSYSSDTRNNWIGHLQKLIRHTEEGPPAVHNFAVSGDTVEDDLDSQMQRLFENFPTAGSLENSDKALFVFWMGINDCGQTAADELKPIVEKLFDSMHDIYVKWKGRSFLLMDVPPMERTPIGLSMEIDSERYDTWNRELLAQASEFSKSASKASVFLVSAHRIISDILDKPEEFGFSSESEGPEESFGDESDDDENEDQGRAPKIWEDDIHISRTTHRLLAERLLKVFDRE